jgi:hypothetical protein
VTAPEIDARRTEGVVMECPLCGSCNVEIIEGDYATGVVAPDGGEERWWSIGMRCKDCHAIEEL